MQNAAGASHDYNLSSEPEDVIRHHQSCKKCAGNVALLVINLFSSCPFPVDGVFGQCQELAGADLYTYDISSSALQRLRVILQKLAYRGTNRLSVFVHNLQPLVKS